MNSGLRSAGLEPIRPPGLRSRRRSGPGLLDSTELGPRESPGRTPGTRAGTRSGSPTDSMRRRTTSRRPGTPGPSPPAGPSHLRQEPRRRNPRTGHDTTPITVAHGDRARQLDRMTRFFALAIGLIGW